MFEEIHERFWFGDLAKRAAPAAPVSKVSPLLLEMSGAGSDEERAALHARNEFDKNFFRTPDLQDKLREELLLKMHLGGAPVPGSEALRQENLAKVLDLEDLTKLPGGRATLPFANTLTNTDDELPLAKRYSKPDAREMYRQYFRARLQKGMTAETALEEWLDAFPHRNPDVELLMVEIAQEFAT